MHFPDLQMKTLKCLSLSANHIQFTPIREAKNLQTVLVVHGNDTQPFLATGVSCESMPTGQNIAKARICKQLWYSNTWPFLPALIKVWTIPSSTGCT